MKTQTTAVILSERGSNAVTPRAERHLLLFVSRRRLLARNAISMAFLALAALMLTTSFAHAQAQSPVLAYAPVGGATAGNCAFWTNTATLGDTGAPCGGGGGTAWSSLTAPTGDLSLNMAGHKSSFTNGNFGFGVAASADYVQSIQASSSTGTIVFTGAGLNDMTKSGAYVGSQSCIYTITIDGIGTPDTYSWDDGSCNGSASTIPIVAGPVLLSNGTSITFAATTGHTLTDNWAFTPTVINQLAITNAAGDNAFGVLNDRTSHTGPISGFSADANAQYYMDVGSNTFGVLDTLTPNQITNGEASGISSIIQLNSSSQASNIEAITGLASALGNGVYAIGVQGEAIFKSAGNSTGNIFALYGSALNIAGTVTNLSGMAVSASTSAGQTTTDQSAIWVQHNTGTGAVTNNYGLLVDDQTVGVNNYAIKTGLGLNSFGDRVQLGTVHFAALGAVVPGQIFYCDDCDPSTVSGVANQCTSAGAKTGAMVNGTNAKWACMSVN